MLACPVALKRLEPIPGRSQQIVECLRPDEIIQFAPGHYPEGTRARSTCCPRISLVIQVRGPTILEATYHSDTIQNIRVY